MADCASDTRPWDAIVTDLRAGLPRGTNLFRVTGAAYFHPLLEEAAKCIELFQFNFALNVKASHRHYEEMRSLREQLRLANAAIIKRNRRIKNLRAKLAQQRADLAGETQPKGDAE